MSIIAIIKTGGKQYIVKEGTVLKVEKLAGIQGDKLVFDQVLLSCEKEAEPRVGMPILEGVKVEASILEQGKSDKVVVIKYKPKIRYKRKHGHRQAFTKVKIEKIVA